METKPKKEEKKKGKDKKGKDKKGDKKKKDEPKEEADEPVKIMETVETNVDQKQAREEMRKHLEEKRVKDMEELKKKQQAKSAEVVQK